jgi:hypothetical protein
MKNWSLFLAGIVFAFSATALANVADFTDHDLFDSWYEDAVDNMSDAGIITGYEDGSFGPTNNVNRAEMAVMLDRFDEHMDEAIEDYFVREIEDIIALTLAYADTDYDVRSFLILAENGMRELDEAPSVSTTSSDWQEDNANLPEGYTLYVDEVAESGNAYYLYFDGEYCEDDTCGNYKQQWYGPFFY